MAPTLTFDGVVVVGAGLAGLSAALAAAPRRVMVLSPAPLTQAAASAWAQGGVAAALGPDDSPALHAADTVAAGAGLCDPAMVERLTADGAAAVRWLAALGAPFDRDAAGDFVLGLEAAHSRPRVARVKGDQAGGAIMAAVARAVLAAPHIEVREGVRARALLQDGQGRVGGVRVCGPDGDIDIHAASVILATGGIGGLYAVTTNPPGALGQGLAMAALAGARIADPEFVQFHPTAIDVGRDPAPLATEALRGDGAVLVDRTGRRFMAEAHPLAELAPRDVVARAIHARLLAGDGAFLDARAAVGPAFPERFPTVFAACMAAGLDPRTAPIPVAPAAHYHMGGAATDADGRTSLTGLYAAGECAGTGVHGANRLASNSLLEAVVFGRRAGAAAADAAAARGVLAARRAGDLPHGDLQLLRRAMSRGAGVIRDEAGLAAVADQISSLDAAHGPTLAAITARLIVEAALRRRESRGGHFRSDHPEPGPVAARTFTTLDAARRLDTAFA